MSFQNGQFICYSKIFWTWIMKSFQYFYGIQGCGRGPRGALLIACLYDENWALTIHPPQARFPFKTKNEKSMLWFVTTAGKAPNHLIKTRWLWPKSNYQWSSRSRHRVIHGNHHSTTLSLDHVTYHPYFDSEKRRCINSHINMQEPATYVFIFRNLFANIIH